MKFGEYLRHLRQARGWSQEELAARSNGRLTQSFISAVERSPKRRPKDDKIQILAEVFGMDFETLRARIHASPQQLASAERGHQTLEAELLAFSADRPDVMAQLQKVREENTQETWEIIVRVLHQDLIGWGAKAREIAAAVNKPRD